MQVLTISDVYFPRVNGVSTSIQTFRADLLELGHQCTLVAPAYPGLRGGEDDVIRIASRSVPRDPEDRLLSRAGLRAQLPRLRERGYDVIHIQTPFAAHYAGVELGQRLGLPLVESYHTYFEHYLHHYLPVLPRRLAAWLARRFTLSQCQQVQAVISPSRQMADALRGYGVTTPITVLPTGLPPERFQPGNGARFRVSQGISASRPTILFVGRVAHEKNIDFLFRMLLDLRKRIPSVLLIVAGEGPALPHCRAMVDSLALGGNVMFKGYMDRARELPDCYRAADAFVFASRTETQGLVLLEAMAQGTPVVSTAMMGTIDVLADRRGAVVVPEEEGPFAEAVARLLLDPVRRAELSAGALLAAEAWSSRNMASRLVDLYREVSGDGAAVQLLAGLGMPDEPPGITAPAVASARAVREAGL